MKSLGKQLSLCWRYDAGESALIWQLMFTGTGDLIGQKRYVANRQALLFSIDSLTGQVLNDGYQVMSSVNPVSTGEDWFTGLETTSWDLVYCYAYQQHSPEHQGIWAVDLRNGREVWARRDIIFAANFDHEFLVYQLSVFAGLPERHFMFIDPATGETIRQLGSDSFSINAVRAQFVVEEERQQVILPEFVVDGMAVERLALQKAGVSDKARCECIVQGSLTFAALHEPNASSGLWCSSIKVWLDDHLVYTDSMEEHVDKPCLNNFLIRGSHFYYIKKKQELVCVAIS
ncbi:MAG: DUF4905 domain-containing protein [Chlorobiaceae bacterium]